MGTIFATPYTTLSMGFHDIELYGIIRNEFTLPASNYFEQNWKKLLGDRFIFLRLSLTRNAARCNNPNDLANHSFILKVSVFSEAYLEPCQTSLMKLFAKIGESH